MQVAIKVVYYPIKYVIWSNLSCWLWEF